MPDYGNTGFHKEKALTAIFLSLLFLLTVSCGRREAPSIDMPPDEPDIAAAPQDPETGALPGGPGPSSDTASPVPFPGLAVVVEDTDSAAEFERREAFDLALTRLAEDFDATGEPADYEHLTAYLEKRTDFAALTANIDDQVAVLRRGFTVGGTRERILVHYAIAYSAVELDPEKWPDLAAGLDAVEPLDDLTYDEMLSAVASHPEPFWAILTGELSASGPYMAEDAPGYRDTMNVLYALFPIFPRKPDVVRYTGVRADGMQVELQVETCISVADEATSVLFRLTGNSRAYQWSYEIRGEQVLPVVNEISPGEALKAIYLDTDPVTH